MNMESHVSKQVELRTSKPNFARLRHCMLRAVCRHIVTALSEYLFSISINKDMDARSLKDIFFDRSECTWSTRCGCLC